MAHAAALSPHPSTANPSEDNPEGLGASCGSAAAASGPSAAAVAAAAAEAAEAAGSAAPDAPPESSESLRPSPSEEWPERPKPPRQLRFFIGGVSQEVEEQEVWELFSKFGRVSGVRLAKDYLTGRKRGFGFVTMEEEGPLAAILGAPHFLRDKKIEVRRENENTPSDFPRKVFLGGLPPALGSDQLALELARFGEVETVQIATDMMGRSRCFGFATFKQEKVAESLIGQGSCRIGDRLVEIRRPEPKRSRPRLDRRGSVPAPCDFYPYGQQQQQWLLAAAQNAQLYAYGAPCADWASWQGYYAYCAAAAAAAAGASSYQEAPATLAAAAAYDWYHFTPLTPQHYAEAEGDGALQQTCSSSSQQQQTAQQQQPDAAAPSPESSEQQEARNGAAAAAAPAASASCADTAAALPSQPAEAASSQRPASFIYPFSSSENCQMSEESEREGAAPGSTGAGAAPA
ncbi:hypothetical protein, conserved [Eimeria tenella]|uniref:RRM domain-containing protein n=1 Tax=Eimeria tenella TaxID=5802 RepID=U6KSB3_EIMTE|nr:hypothetical protein, conserved [Eimeria tenella]CDJ38318.1 hypothetical protein, conserved [Eimeria tenella]|eukprot:XP_013229156.1 hypothetical protein, conserved [Eimeria tenella]